MGLSLAFVSSDCVAARALCNSEGLYGQVMGMRRKARRSMVQAFNSCCSRAHLHVKNVLRSGKAKEDKTDEHNQAWEINCSRQGHVGKKEGDAPLDLARIKEVGGFRLRLSQETEKDCYMKRKHDTPIPGVAAVWHGYKRPRTPPQTGRVEISIRPRMHPDHHLASFYSHP